MGVGGSFSVRSGAIPKRQASCPTITASCAIDFGTIARGGVSKCVFLRNEPTVLAGEISRIMPMTKYLWRLQKVFARGFVLENEPTGGVF